MPTGQLDYVVCHLRRLAARSAAQQWTDAQLLERYVTCHDEEAFATLVHRHGRLVRSVCGHVLHCEQDIDDAFQVTFLVFVSKAASIRRTASVASWLYGVAYRTARNARRARRRRREEQGEPEGYAREQPLTEAALHEVQAILDDEVQHAVGEVPSTVCPVLPGRKKSGGGGPATGSEGRNGVQPPGAGP